MKFYNNVVFYWESYIVETIQYIGNIIVIRNVLSLCIYIKYDTEINNNSNQKSHWTISLSHTHT